MNVLPLILALILVLSVLTIEKSEKFKNQMIVHNEYQLFLKEGERDAFNQRQKNLFSKECAIRNPALKERSHRQISCAYLIKKEHLKQTTTKGLQYRLLLHDLMKIVYGEAPFFKEMEKKRPQFLEELLRAIEEAAKKAPDELIKRVEDMARLDLGDPELQNVFYHMLKGTVTRKQLKALPPLSSNKEKAYPSLLVFIHDGTQKITVQRCSKEVLKAIFLSDEVVNAICAKRQELAANKGTDARIVFESEFKEKRRPDIDASLLDFTISSSDKTGYD